MKHQNSHLPDQQLLLLIDGELPALDEVEVVAHLEGCWRCRSRRQELESAITDFTRAHQRQFESKLPPAVGPRAWLKSQLAALPAMEPKPPANWFSFPRALVWVAAICAVAVVGLILNTRRSSSPHSQFTVLSVPNATLTPGAALLVTRRTVCEQTSTNNKAVPVALQRKVFDEYGIAGADPGAYEVDYLVTPALGGSDDIHNLWPHSYSSTAWNAEVKDALEDRLHQMVCDGSLDLTEAQREIAANWIAAYKKYFHTDSPLKEHWQHHQ